MPIEIVSRYCRQDLQANPRKLFVFGDNDARRGLGGQAREARGEPNAIGVSTKKVPQSYSGAFYTDLEYASNVGRIFADFGPILNALARGCVVVWPADGIGTGYARMPEYAPLTLLFIDTLVDSLKRVYGATGPA